MWDGDCGLTNYPGIDLRLIWSLFQATQELPSAPRPRGRARSFVTAVGGFERFCLEGCESRFAGLVHGHPRGIILTDYGPPDDEAVCRVILHLKELAVNVFTEVEDHRGPSTFDIAILARPGKDLKEVEKALYAEIDRLKTEPIADWELQKVRMSTRRQTAQRLMRDSP